MSEEAMQLLKLRNKGNKLPSAQSTNNLPITAQHFVKFSIHIKTKLKMHYLKRRELF
jgi:hypothetical protein